MADFQQNFLNSFQTGLGIGQQVRGIQDRNRINQLASQGYSASAEQRPELLGQIAAVDARAAQQQEQSFANTDERRNNTMVNMAKLLTSAPEQARPQLWAKFIPTLSQYDLSELPTEYNEQTAPIINQAAQSLVGAYGGASSQLPTDVRSFQQMTSGLSDEDRERARRINLGLDGRASSSGFSQVKFTGPDGRERLGSFNGKTGQIDLPDGTSFNPQSGAMGPTPQGGAQPQSQSAIPGFGIAETDNYVRNILGKVQVDPNASPEQQAEQLLPALIQQESGGNPNAVSPKGAAGLTQVMPATGRDPGFGVSPLQNNSPEENVRFGREYLTAMLRRYPGRPDLALAAYNAGPGVADRFASPVASAAGGALTGRRAEDEAAAVERAKAAVELETLPAKIALETQGAIERAGGTSRAEAEAKREADLATSSQKKYVDAGTTLALLDQAEPLIRAATGSLAGNARDQTLAAFGQTTDGAAAIAALNPIAANLTLAVPRMEGPQSDADRLMYQQAAGNFNNPNATVGQKMAAFQTMKTLAQRYRSSGAGQRQPGGSPRQIQSASDYDALPSGATYIDPQGNQRRKR